MNGIRTTIIVAALCCGLALNAQTTGYKIVGWNDLGMHCVDGNDYSVFSILPPFNNLHAHVINADGKLVKSGSTVRLTYQAVTDPERSFNSYSSTYPGRPVKTNFWEYVQQLFGVKLAPEMGLAGNAMPGPSNTPQAMKFDSTKNEWVAEGIPIMPYDDAGNKNYYPLLRIVARDSAGRQLTTSDVVLPVSDEMDCRACHASGSSPSTAMPEAGWVWNSDAQKDYKLNILRLHDERRDASTYAGILSAAGYTAAGLYASATGGKSVLCAACHPSNALPGTTKVARAPLTQVLHAGHADAVDPANNLTLDASENRAACYRCHPGSVTKCLRGAMGNAVASDGSMLMQCQSCHGSMRTVGASTRQGWLDEPGCQTCHTGTALQNSGQVRYTDAFVSSGLLRTAANNTFAVNSGKLYRMSKGHGGLNCESCHGSTHAEYPSSHANDNLQIVKLQGHSGTLAECTACHKQMPETISGGPHGMHPVGQYWVGKHEGVVESQGAGQCRTCHGTDYRGTVLSAAFANRSLRVEDRNVSFGKGTQIGCYNCHNGPNPD